MKRKNKSALFLILSLIILNTALIVYLANFKYYVFNEEYYKKQFEKNKIYAVMLEADKALDNLFLFFNDKKDLDNFFNKDEKAHLQDVKVLIDKVIVIFYISVFLEIFFIFLLYFLIKKGFKIYLKFILLNSSGLIILISIIFYLFSNSFQFIFVKFHEIFFPQGNWLFPYNSNLIMLFPQEFFYDFFYKIIINAFIFSLFVFTLGLLLFFEEK